jgi:hypothetical protein
MKTSQDKTDNVDNTITDKLEFFDPAQFDAHVHGFFEEIVDLDTYKCYGVRLVEKPDRPLGSDGRKVHTFTEDFEVMRCFKTHVIKASVKNPRRCLLTLQPICGRPKKAHPLDCLENIET